MCNTYKPPADVQAMEASGHCERCAGPAAVGARRCTTLGRYWLEVILLTRKSPHWAGFTMWSS